MKTDEVKTYSLELLCIVSMGQQHHRQDIRASDVLLQMLGAHLGQLGEHEVVRVDQELQEELYALLPDIEVIWVEKLDYAIEKDFWYALNLDDPETILPSILNLGIRRLSKFVAWAKHGLKIFTSMFEDNWICLNQAFVNAEDHIKEFVNMHAKLHLLQRFRLIRVSFFLWRKDEIVCLGLCFSKIIFEGGCEHIQVVHNLLIDDMHNLLGYVCTLFSLCLELLELKISRDPLLELLL